VPLNGEANRKLGVYKNVCCGVEIVINAGSMFPDCPNHPGATTMWRPVVNDWSIGQPARKPAIDSALDAHIENRHLLDLAGGRLRLEDWQQNHLHRCKVCQGVLYVFVHQPKTTVPGNAGKRPNVA